MRNWVWSGEIALVFGAIAFVLLFVPIVVWQSRRYGGFNLSRLIGAGAVCLYLTALATYTWLPLPADPAAWCARHPNWGPQLMPFEFISDIRRLTAGMGWRERLTSFAVLQVGFNVALFLPWGIIARRYFHRSIAWATLTGLAISVFIELTQYTGLWFILPCAYRLADVDDLIANTAGAALGAVIAPALLWWMPRARTLAASRLEPRPVTVWRRWLGMAIDYAAWTLLSSIGLTVLMVVAMLTGIDRSGQLWMVLYSAVSIGSWFLVFILPTFNGGGSLGHSAVWLYPRWPDATGRLGSGPWWLRILRSCVVSLPLLAVSLLPENDPPPVLSDVLGLIATAVVLASIVSVPLTANKRGLSCLLTRATMTDSRERT